MRRTKTAATRIFAASGTNRQIVVYFTKSGRCGRFVKRNINEETDDGRNMQEVSELLNDAINSIIDVKEESDIDSLFSAGGTSALMSEINGLDDFELICFLVVK